MLETRVIRVVRAGGVGVAARISDHLNSHARTGKPLKVVAVVPLMLAYFADCPKRYEVIEADVIVQEVE